VNELVGSGFVALLLEQRPGVLVERDPEERRLLVLHRLRVGAGRAGVVPHRRGGRADRTPSRRCATRSRPRTWDRPLQGPWAGRRWRSRSGTDRCTTRRPWG